MKHAGIFILLVLSFPVILNAQEKKLVQLSGKVMDELMRPLPYAHVLVMNSYRGAITNNYGNFSLVAEENDSVLISSVGYKTKYIVVPDDLPDQFMNMDIVLQADTLFLNEAVIYPWRTYEDFKRAFLSLDLPNRDLENARRNIALIRTQIILDNEPNARANFQYVMEQQYKETFTQGMYPTYRLLNPFNWAEFFRALKRGDFRFNNDD